MSEPEHLKYAVGTTPATAVPHPEPFVDAAKAAQFLSLQPRRVLQLARQGLLPGYPLGSGTRHVWRFKLSELAHALQCRVTCNRQSPAPGKET